MTLEIKVAPLEKGGAQEIGTVQQGEGSRAVV